MQVSVPGFSAATLGGEHGARDPAEVGRAVDFEIDHGINFFDVSPYYGRTLVEERLGRFLEGKRERVVLSTNVGRCDRNLPQCFDFSAARVFRSVEDSLRRLRAEVADLLLAHDIEFGRREMILAETLPAMQRLKEQGKVRYIGITGYPPELLREVAEVGEVDVVLSYCHYSLLNTRLEAVLEPFARERGVGLINASPLHMGVLTGVAPRWRPASAEVLRAGREASAWRAEEGLDIADLTLRFALQKRTIASTLVGMRPEAEARANLRALEGAPDQEALAAVRETLVPAKDLEWV